MDFAITVGVVIVTLGTIAFDFKHHRIPNAVTLPLLLGFLLAHWSGTPEAWLGCILLFAGWQMRWMGGGDAKLWMALLWAAPQGYGTVALWVMAAAFLLTGLGQIVWRRARNQPLTGVQSPGAWRTIPYLAWLVVTNMSMIPIR